MRWGILGTARINRRVIPAMRLAKRSELIAVASRDRARAEWYAREWSIPRAIAGYQTLLDDSSIDAVYIPLPNTGHVEWTLAAIAAGKHVLCEKPIALDPHDVDRLAAAAAAANVVVEEGFMYRHEPLTARVMSLVNGGSLNQELVMAKMQENTDRGLGKESDDIINECMVLSAIQSTELALETGL